MWWTEESVTYCGVLFSLYTLRKALVYWQTFGHSEWEVMLKEMPSVHRRGAMIAKTKKKYQIVNICSSKIIMHHYCWFVSLAWPCSFSRDEEGSVVSTPALPSSGVVPELEVGSDSVLPPLLNGLLPLLWSEQSRADMHGVLVQIFRGLLKSQLLNPYENAVLSA